VKAGLGGFRLALLPPLYICLVVIDERARWTALCLYLASILAGLLERRLADPQTPLSRIGDGLLLVVMSLGLGLGGVASIGSAAACAILIGQTLVRLDLNRAESARFGVDKPGKIAVVVSALTVLSFSLALAPRIIGVPKSLDTHQLGGFMLMGCGGVALVSVAVKVMRTPRSGTIGPK